MPVLSYEAFAISLTQKKRNLKYKMLVVSFQKLTVTSSGYLNNPKIVHGLSLGKRDIETFFKHRSI